MSASRALKQEKLGRIYRRSPELYACDVLRVQWYDQQRQIARALIEHRRVMVKAGNGPGKTFLAGGIVNWWYDTHRPSVCITTAPTEAQVVQALWKNVRVQRRGRPGLAPSAAMMQDAPDHFAVGLTARDYNAFQGRHEVGGVLIVFDEATGVAGQFWDAAEGMMTGQDCYWLAILNPTDTASRAYQEEQSGRWHVITLSTLDHPNILASLREEPEPIPGAVTREWVDRMITDPERATPVEPDEVEATDVEWPPGSGQWYRPGPEVEARVLGRWPSAGSYGVWSDAMWQACLAPQPLEAQDVLELGCDVARHGDDFTEIVARYGCCVIHHEAHNGWGTDQTAGRLKELCRMFAERLGFDNPKAIRVKIDDGGVGGGVVDQAGGYAFVGVSAAASAMDEERYPNKRSELWFVTANRARRGRVDFSRLPAASQNRLRTQLMAPTWKLDGQGRRVVEPKEDTKKRIGRSPDSADGLNLAFYTGADWRAAKAAMERVAEARRQERMRREFDPDEQSGEVW